MADGFFSDSPQRPPRPTRRRASLTASPSHRGMQRRHPMQAKAPQAYPVPSRSVEVGARPVAAPHQPVRARPAHADVGAMSAPDRARAAEIEGRRRTPVQRDIQNAVGGVLPSVHGQRVPAALQPNAEAPSVALSGRQLRQRLLARAPPDADRVQGAAGHHLARPFRAKREPSGGYASPPYSPGVFV